MQQPRDIEEFSSCFARSVLSNQRFPLRLAKEIVQAADQKTAHTCDEKCKPIN